MLDLGRTFLQSVERSPNTLALVDGDVRLTYAEWHDTILKTAGGQVTQMDAEVAALGRSVSAHTQQLDKS